MSRSQAKRLIKQGAVELNGKVVVDPKTPTKVGDKIKIGKKFFATVVEKV